MPTWNDQSQYGLYRTRGFVDIFPNKETFYTEYMNIGLGGFQSTDTLNTLYALLYARRGNDAILSSDENKFKYNLFSIIYKYGGDYEKKADIQKRLKELTQEELEMGSRNISNMAQNPSTVPTSQEFEQLKKINQQTATGTKLSKVASMQLQQQSMDNRYIEEFLKKFDELFNPFPPEYPLIYEVEGVQEQ